MIRILTVVVVVMFMFGCANQQVYEGAKRHPDQIAIIKPGSPSFFSFDPSVSIQKVDGTKLDRLSSGKFEVTPGTRTVKAAQFTVSTSGWTSMSTPRTITFETRAGESYVVYYRWRNRRESDWVLIVTEESTGRVFVEK